MFVDFVFYYGAYAWNFEIGVKSVCAENLVQFNPTDLRSMEMLQPRWTADWLTLTYQTSAAVRLRMIKKMDWKVRSVVQGMGERKIDRFHSRWGSHP
jgi:hypothetical protein